MAEESYREFMCKLVYPGCEFAIRAKTDDEVIEHARMTILKQRISTLYYKLKGS